MPGQRRKWLQAEGAFFPHSSISISGGCIFLYGLTWLRLHHGPQTSSDGGDAPDNAWLTGVNISKKHQLAYGMLLKANKESIHLQGTASADHPASTDHTGVRLESASHIHDHGSPGNTCWGPFRARHRMDIIRG